MKTMYSVWVGGGEVNDYLIESLSKAKVLAQSFWDDHYDDVYIEVMVVDDSNNEHRVGWIDKGGKFDDEN